MFQNRVKPPGSLTVHVFAYRLDVFQSRNKSPGSLTSSSVIASRTSFQSRAESPSSLTASVIKEIRSGFQGRDESPGTLTWLTLSRGRCCFRVASDHLILFRSGLSRSSLPVSEPCRTIWFSYDWFEEVAKPFVSGPC